LTPLSVLLKSYIIDYIEVHRYFKAEFLKYAVATFFKETNRDVREENNGIWA